MPRSSQLLELDLRSGVTTNAPTATIGPRLAYAENCVWDYRYPRSTAVGTIPGLWALRQPLTFPSRGGLIEYLGAISLRSLGFSQHTLFTGTKVAAIGANATDQYAVWDATGGAVIPFVGGVTRATILSYSRVLGSTVSWLNPGNDPNGGAALAAGVGVMVFAHPHATHVYYLLDTGAGIRSLTTDVTNCPLGAAALAIHLDRLWLLEGAATGLSKCWYTDPFNLDSIRTTNVVQVPDTGTCLVPGQFGAIDTSGVAHLIIGCEHSVYVLDGDPQLGGGLQADLRQLGSGVGILSSQAACVTPYGVFFLGTDGDLWQIPPGCQTMQKVGEPIRNQLGLNNWTGALDAGTDATGQVVWFDPYLYLFPGGETAWHYLAEPSAQGLVFWGPVTADPLAISEAGREAVVAVPPHNFATHSPHGTGVSVHSVDTVPNASHRANYVVFDPSTAATGTYPNGANLGRGARVRTGLLTVPGHHVQATRVTLEVLAVPAISSTAVARYVTVYDEQGTSYAATQIGSTPAAGTVDARRVSTLHYAVVPQPASRGISVLIESDTTADLQVQRAWVEVHVSPAVSAQPRS